MAQERFRAREGRAEGGGRDINMSRELHGYLSRVIGGLRAAGFSLTTLVRQDGM